MISKTGSSKNACRRFLAVDGLTGSYSGPEVRFEDMASDLLELRFWIISALPTTRELFLLIDTSASSSADLHDRLDAAVTVLDHEWTKKWTLPQNGSSLHPFKRPQSSLQLAEPVAG